LYYLPKLTVSICSLYKTRTYKTVCYAQTIDFHCFVDCVSSNTRKHTTSRISHKFCIVCRNWPANCL